MNYLDKRLDRFQDLIDECAPISKPVILLLDNINLYHGNRRHHRLFKTLGPKMWNFTVRGLLVSHLSEIENLFYVAHNVAHITSAFPSCQACVFSFFLYASSAP